MEKYPDHHYCERCSDFKTHHGDPTSPCQTCVYSDTDGFSNWTPMTFNGTTMNDLVNKPKHYMLMENLEVRDVLAALVAKITKASIHKVPGHYLFESDYVQMMQYLMRFMDKNGKQDLEKAQWYLKKLIAAYD